MRLALAALAGLLLAAPAADARIVVGRSIRGLTLGASEARFRAVLGPADGPRAFGEEPEDYGLDFLGGRYHGLFMTKTRRAYLISTTSSSQQTASGVGPGVSARFARARLRGERCSPVYDADKQITLTQCAIAGDRVETDVDISFGRVVAVSIWRR